MNALIVLLAAAAPALAGARGFSAGSTTPVGGGGATVVEPTQSTLGQQPNMAGGELGDEHRVRAKPEEIELQTGLGLDDSTILEAERELIRRGYPVTAPDGELDPDTRFAIREFQRRNGLRASGDLDLATLSRLRIRVPRRSLEPQT